MAGACIGLRVLVTVIAATQVVLHAPLEAQTVRAEMPDSVRDYLNTAIAIFRERSVHRHVVDWQAFENSVMARAGNAQTPADTWLALTWAMRGVDSHSFLRPPDGMLAALTGGLVPQTPELRERPPLGRLIDGDIGLVRVPAHAGLNRPEYVDSLHLQLREFDSRDLCGWIVDLRDNTGGNMWPMVAGIGPLLGAELVGSFTISPPGSGWRYRDGRSWHGDSTMPAEPAGWGRVSPTPLKHAEAPVAVLVGPETASSGEMILIAFLGRPRVRTFGDSTAGYASSNSTVALRDGATLVITSSHPRDRLGRRHPLRIGPDELVREQSDADAVLLRAAAWLRRESACTVPM